MKTITAKEAHKKLGLVLDEAQHEPVSISKNGRPYSVVVSARWFEEIKAFEALQADRKWDRLFATEKSETLLTNLAEQVRQNLSTDDVLPCDSATQDNT